MRELNRKVGTPHAPKPKIDRLTFDLLQKLCVERRDEIEDKLKEFKRAGGKPDGDIFEELVYCMLTVQSSARSAERGIAQLRRKGLLLHGRSREVEGCLRGVRFARTKAKRIIGARRMFSSKNGIKAMLPADPQLARRFLAKNVEGIGYKEASHFLRNIGYCGLAILDRHVLRGLFDLKVIEAVGRVGKGR